MSMRRVATALLALLVTGLPAPDARAESVWQADLVLPAFSGEPLRGADLEGRPLLLQFWASWCRSCMSLMDEVDELAERFPGVRYLAISLDDDIESGQRYLDRLALFAKHPGRFYFDQDGDLKSRLAVLTVPTFIIVDATGDEVHRHVGHINSAELQALRTWLARVDIREVASK
ncbi:MAG TPA: TlpA disulfide reductase family protein [Xanthomonadaceae bacterium]|nr:TlpA disulfide reductase family protein [Xanthomonadaceae bacterium]